MPRQEAKSLLVPGRGKHEYLQNLNTLIKAEHNRETILSASLAEVQKALEDGPIDDAYWSACFILACAISLDSQAMSKLPKSFKTHFVDMREIESAEICEKIIAILVSKLLVAEGSSSTSFQLLGKLLEVCREKSALFTILIIRKVLQGEYADVITHRSFWKHACSSLSELSKDKIDEKSILSLFMPFLRKTVEAIGSFGFAGIEAMPRTFGSYFTAFEIVWKLIPPQNFNSTHSESITVVLLLMAKLKIAIESTSCFETAFTLSMSSTELSGDIFDSLRKISDGSSANFFWLEEQNMNPSDLIMNLIFTGTNKIATPSCLAMQLDNITSLIFTVLPSYWSFSSRTQYETILEQLSDCLFKITSFKSGSSSKYWNQIVSSCHARLFSPHPLVHNLALDLWCMIIRGSHKDANKEVAPQIGQLLLHLAERLFSSATPKLESILANEGVTVKARSIAYRVISSLPRHMQTDIDKAFSSSREKSSIMKLLNKDIVTPSDKDLFLLDVLPLKLMMAYEGIDQILSNLASTLPRELDASPRSYLMLRAIYRLIQLPNDRYKEETVRIVNQKLGSLHSIFKPSNLSYHEIEKKSELIALVFDILGEIKPLKLVIWKMWVMNLTPHIAFVPPNIKIAFVQFLSKVLLDGDADVNDDMTGVSRIVTQLVQDKDWKVASEAILSYSHFQKRFPLSIQMKTALSKLVEQLEDQEPEGLTQQENQILVSSTIPAKETAVKEAISSLRVTIQRYSEQQDSQQQSDLLAEFSQTLAKLARLEQKISLSSTSAVIL